MSNNWFNQDKLNQSPISFRVSNDITLMQDSAWVAPIIWHLGKTVQFANTAKSLIFFAGQAFSVEWVLWPVKGTVC